MIALLGACFAACVAPAAWAAGKVEFAVVASADVSVKSLSLSDVRRIFTLDRRFWRAGQPIVTLMPGAGTRQRQLLLGRICGMDEAQYRQMILEKMYRGEVDLAPKVVNSDEDALSYVAASRGLIAIVPAALASSSHARMMPIGGKLPGAAGYELRE